MEEKILVLSLFFIAIIWIYIKIANITKVKEIKCNNNEKHDWVFSSNRNGITGDLGFGIKARWDINEYHCTKCWRTKEVKNI